MTFEVAPVPVRAGHWRIATLFVGLLAVAIVGSAVITKPSPATPQKAVTDGSLLTALRLPARLDCHDLARPTCETATRTALSLLVPADGTVEAAGAWKSILCADS